MKTKDSCAANIERPFIGEFDNELGKGLSRRFPSDWPSPGLVNIAVHDLPHQSSNIEFWYVNGHFEVANGHKLSVFAAFFRKTHNSHKTTKRANYAHSVIWALSDATDKVYYGGSQVDKRAPEIWLKRIREGHSKDPRLRALAEVLEKGRVPEPDHLLEGVVYVGRQRLKLDFAGLRFEKQNDGSYRLSLFNPRVRAGCNIVFHPEKPPIRHCDDGVVDTMDECMFYYFIPRCRLTGSVTLNGIRQPIVSGMGWYDHEFGGHSSDQAVKAGSNEGIQSVLETAWNWTAIQLNDGSEITAACTFRCATQEAMKQWLIIIDPDGHPTSYQDIEFKPVRWWRSTRTFLDYPICWRLDAPKAGIHLTIQASFNDQEFITFMSGHALWEGRCDVKGTVRGRRVSGLAYIERSGFESIKDLDGFFSAAGEEVQKSVKNIIPFEPSFEQVRDLIASKEREHYMVGVNIDQLVRSMVRPIREITDRGGKSWRSYAVLACCDVVGGDSRKYVQWLAMPELIHVGSLIVDDVEDQSTVRRGGLTCHLIYGEPIAINTGTAAYFMGQKLLISSNGISNAKKLLLYDLYFEALRAAHAGQALDIDGLNDLMPEIVKSGDSTILEQGVLAVYRLKTGVPAATLARMGAIVGGGTKDQIEALGRYFEALGIAFQIIDDVLNLRGFQRNLKAQGEDITKGKVTLPIAKALSILPFAERKWIWSTLQSQPANQKVVSSVVEKLEACGVLDACVKQGHDLIETTWRNLEPKLEDSFPKIMLRAFGWYILERHY
jgi:geranylgeranyl pyrophosphate synthase/predicted secreted hydrolase